MPRSPKSRHYLTWRQARELLSVTPIKYRLLFLFAQRMAGAFPRCSQMLVLGELAFFLLSLISSKRDSKLIAQWAESSPSGVGFIDQRYGGKASLGKRSFLLGVPKNRIGFFSKHQKGRCHSESFLLAPEISLQIFGFGSFGSQFASILIRCRRRFVIGCLTGHSAIGEILFQDPVLSQILPKFKLPLCFGWHTAWNLAAPAQASTPDREPRAANLCLRFRSAFH